MSARTYSKKIPDHDDVIAGYRAVAGATESRPTEMPTFNMDSAILSAARERSRQRRSPPPRYTAAAAAAACLMILLVPPESLRHAPSSAPVPVSRETAASPENRDEMTSKASTSAAARFARVPPAFRLWQNTARKDNAMEFNNLVLSAYPSGTGFRTAAEVSTAFVDLNEPGALDRLARNNPEHYSKVRKILAGVDEIPEQAVGRWMKAQFNATDVSYSPYLLTSNPPLKRLSFTLQTTRYQALLMLTDEGARLLPAHR